MRSSPFVSAVAAALSLARTVSALQVVGPVSNLLISNAVVKPDGVARNAIVVNGQFPGPLITGQPNSQYKLTVQDKLNDDSMLTPTSIHWHGLFQKNTSFADGTAFVSQCPITPDNQFTYAFNSRGQAGTFWYHSHYGPQYCDGLRGPFVVYDPNDPLKHLYDVDTQDTVITLADWYHKPALQHAPFDIADSALINGLGRSWVNTTATALAVVKVAHNVRYRFRIISLSCDPAFEFSIDNHTMTVIEADGNLHQPLSVDSITVHAGQRYSVVVIANQKIGNYRIRAKPIHDLVSFPDFFAGGINSAILRYNGAPNVEPTTVQTGGQNPLVEARLQPLSNPAAPGAPDVNAPDVFKMNMNFNFNPANATFNINGVNTQLPSVPILLQILSGAKAAQDFSGASNVFTLPKNRVIQLSLPASPSAPTRNHPIHLHGHAFSVIRSAGQTDYNFNNPPRRDVVNMGDAGDNVTIRFTTDNAGPWFLHCHIDFHLAAGFAAVFAEDPADVKQSISAGNGAPKSFDNLCPAFNDFSAKSGHPAPVIL